MDIVFPATRVVVNVNGCFWHGCDEHYRPARTNATFWSTKIAGNRMRDDETDAMLTAEGWFVIRVWEHENVVEAAARIEAIIAKRRR